MGKTSIFGRQSSSRKSTNEQKDVREKSRRESSEKRKIRESKTSGLHSDDKLSGRKLSERLTPAKQLSENRNSLKRRKKHETVRTMVQSLPKDKEGRPGGNYCNTITMMIPWQYLMLKYNSVDWLVTSNNEILTAAVLWYIYMIWYI